MHATIDTLTTPSITKKKQRAITYAVRVCESFRLSNLIANRIKIAFTLRLPIGPDQLLVAIIVIEWQIN